MPNIADIMSLSVLGEQRRVRSLWYISICISSSLSWLPLSFIASSWLFFFVSPITYAVFSNPLLFIEKTFSTVFHSHSDDCRVSFWGHQYKFRFSSQVSSLDSWRAVRRVSDFHHKSDCFQSLVTFSDLQKWVMSQEMFILHQAIRL